MIPTTTQPRKRDSAATRQALLDAASELFSMRGFDATSLREIGERAGVDPSLIARYFGNKLALYAATLAAEAPPDTLTGEPSALVRRLVQRVDQQGLGPIVRALIETGVDPGIRLIALDHMRQRTLTPMQARMPGADAGLRAELVLAMAIGVATVRAAGSLPAIANAAPDDLVAVAGEALDRMACERM